MDYIRKSSVFFLFCICINMHGYGVQCNDLTYEPPVQVQHTLNCFWCDHMRLFMERRDDIMRMALGDGVSGAMVDGDLCASRSKYVNAMIKVYREVYYYLLQVGCTVFKCDAKTLVMSVPGLDGYVCKMPGYTASFYMRNIYHHTRRVVLAQKLYRYCEKNNLHDYVKVPCKYLYRLPGCEDLSCNEQCLVVAQRCNITKINSYDQLSLKHVQALVSIVSTFGLDDFTGDNVGIDECGHVVFIDTEDDIWGRSLPEMKLFISKVCKQQGIGITSLDGMDGRAIKKLYRRIRGLQALLKLRCFLTSTDNRGCLLEHITQYAQSIQQDFF
ncbi:MAG: hypothetical protein US69_C0002G0107 [candidate division TM6 bacterium GW2011_GWF2_38_10]|nr:MAG: hypothetical protein US69_C0002G0107 [candidate division TM6 bacterium GW2011_GWF2_38_10]